MGHVLPVPRARFFDANGTPLAGGKLYTYAAGTSTLLATYTTKSEATANANPVILDANGEASIFIGSSSYKFVLHDANDVPLWTQDNVAHINDKSVTATKIADGFLSADADGLALMADGYLSNTTAGHAKMADGYLSANAEGRAKMADGYITTAKLDPAFEAPNVADGSVTLPKLAAKTIGTSVSTGGLALSASSGAFSTTTTGANVTNLSVTIVTTGRPVLWQLVPESGNFDAHIGVLNTGSSVAEMDIFLGRATDGAASATTARSELMGGAGGATSARVRVPPAAFGGVDFPPAGSHVYNILVTFTGATTTASFFYCKLLAYEI